MQQNLGALCESGHASRSTGRLKIHHFRRKSVPGESNPGSQQALRKGPAQCSRLGPRPRNPGPALPCPVRTGTELKPWPSRDLAASQAAGLSFLVSRPRGGRPRKRSRKVAFRSSPRPDFRTPAPGSQAVPMAGGSTSRHPRRGPRLELRPGLTPTSTRAPTPASVSDPA